jgi:hypothetical protein
MIGQCIECGAGVDGGNVCQQCMLREGDPGVAVAPITRPNVTPNRATRRAALKALPKSGDELAGWEEVDLRGAKFRGKPLPASLVRCWHSMQLSVQEYRSDCQPAFVECRLSVRRHDGQRLREHWRTIFRIKGLCGYSLNEAVEVHPPAVDLVDDAPMWHLWVFGVEHTLSIKFERDRR